MSAPSPPLSLSLSLSLALLFMSILPRGVTVVFVVFP
jgi:hypothetical protein